ncbi:MAG: hypothetical protein ACK5NK_00885 [Niabella sp.]
MTDTKKSPSLPFCIIMDIIGCASYIVPGAGEIIDIVWAPISAAIFAKSFSGSKGKAGAVFNFIEEAVPGLDIIPTFTIMWFITNKSNLFNKNKTTIIPVKGR